MVNCSGSSTGAPYGDVDPAIDGAGAGGALGLGTAIARGGVVVGFTGRVSDGFAELLLCGLVDFSATTFFFFLVFGDVSFAGLLFGLGCNVGSGVSLGVADASADSVGDFFLFGLGETVGESEPDGRLFFLREIFAVALGVGVSSEFTARAFKIRGDFSESGDCAWMATTAATSALSARKQRNRPTATQRNRVLRAFNS
jgi:hypothetical protein